MGSSGTDKVFAGPIPKFYEAYLVPLLFEPYAADLANRLASRSLGRVLELAAGTGVVTRALATVLPERVSIVATDLNQPMLDQASALGTPRPVDWRQADAMQLPFQDGSFDAVVCQFGVMFFPDKAKALSEARRVLRPEGVLVFNVWDRIEENEFCWVVNKAVGQLFPGDPPKLMTRTAYGYYDTATIAQELSVAGFGAVSMETVERLSHAPSAHDLAIGFCQGSPLRSEIEARAATRLAEATKAATEALLARFGPGPIVGKMRAHVFTATKE